MPSPSTVPRLQGPLQEGADQGLALAATLPRLRVRLYTRQGVQHHRHHLPGRDRGAGLRHAGAPHPVAGEDLQQPGGGTAVSGADLLGPAQDQGGHGACQAAHPGPQVLPDIGGAAQAYRPLGDCSLEVTIV